LTFYFRALYLISSSCPLFILMAVAAYGTSRSIASASAVGAVISIVCFMYLVVGVKQGAKDFKRISAAKNTSESIFSYTLSILPPLLIDDFSNYSRIIPSATFYIIMYAILMRSQIITLNPLFVICGYRVSTVAFEGSANELVVISKQETDLQPGKMASIWEIQRSTVFYIE